MKNNFSLTVIGKYGPFPRANSCTSSYLVRGNDTKILLDMGSGSLSRVQSLIGLSELSAVLISHTHFDHISDLFVLQYCLQVSNRVMDLYLPDDGSEMTRILSSMGNFAVHLYSDNSSIDIGSVSVRFAKMFHAVDSYGMIVSSCDKSLFYSGDTAYDEEVALLCAQCDVCLLDCSQLDGSTSSHMTISEGKSIALRVKSRILATHLNPLVDYTEQSGELEFVDEMKEYIID